MKGIDVPEHSCRLATDAVGLAVLSARTADTAVERLSRLETLVGYQRRMFNGILEALERDDARAAGILARTGARWESPLYVGGKRDGR